MSKCLFYLSWVVIYRPGRFPPSFELTEKLHNIQIYKFAWLLELIKLLIIVGEFYMMPDLGPFVSTLGVINGTQNVGPRESRAKNCNSAVSAREREKRDR